MSKKILLTVAVPDIKKYWDFARNKTAPDTLGASSSEKVWTLCPKCGNSINRNVRFTWKLGNDGVGHVIHCRTCGKRNNDNSLINCFPDIKKYWDYEKNENPPEYYAVSSDKKVYVKCPECGESIYRALHDTVPRGPDGKYHLSICINCLKLPNIKRRFRKGKRLTECYPGIKELWVYEKNTCTPEELTPFSHETIYIKCPICGDVLKRSCNNSFTKDGNKVSLIPCHKCGVNMSIKKKASEKPISDMFPDIYDWWDSGNNSLIPEEISHRSRHLASFICPDCHKSFKRSIRDFITVHKDGSYLPVGCPSCDFTPRENPEENLLKLCPEISLWSDYEKNYPHVPEEYTAGSTQFAYLKCPDCGMELYTGIHSLVETLEDGTVNIRHKGKCRKYRAMASDNNIVNNYPEIRLWWNYEKNAPHLPEEYTLFSPLRAHFKCPDCGAESEKRMKDAFNLLDGETPQIFKCPYCADIRVQAGINDLMTTHPELAKEYSPNNERDINTIRKNLYYFAMWICPDCNGEYRYNVSKRELGDNVCPYCANKQTLPGFNDLQTTDPELAKEYSPNNELKPTEIRKSLLYSVLWICPTCTGEYRYSLSEREFGDNVCPYCAGKKVLPGMNDIKTRHPELMKKWLDVENSFIGVVPEYKLSTSQDKAWWKCPDCNYSYMMPIAKMVLKEKRGHNPCPRCTGHRWAQTHYF